MCMQSCTHRDEDLISEKNLKENIKSNVQMRSDSAKSSEQIVDPDPPVRDGDNWRHRPHH